MAAHEITMPEGWLNKTDKHTDIRRLKVKKCLRCKRQRPFSKFAFNKSNDISARCIDCIREMEFEQKIERSFNRKVAKSGVSASTILRARIRNALTRVFKEYRGVEKANITMIYMMNLYIQQKGLCALTGRKMKLGSKSGGDALSVDRIDSARGYVTGNVRFVTLHANIAKNQYTDNELLLLCRDILAHHKAGGTPIVEPSIDSGELHEHFAAKSVEDN